MLTWCASLLWLQLFRMDIRTAARALMFHDQTRRHYERKSGPATLLNMALLQHTVELEWDNARWVGGSCGCDEAATVVTNTCALCLVM